MRVSDDDIAEFSRAIGFDYAILGMTPREFLNTHVEEGHKEGMHARKSGTVITDLIDFSKFNMSSEILEAVKSRNQKTALMAVKAYSNDEKWKGFPSVLDFVRKHLQLRNNALARRRIVSNEVTPRLLSWMHMGICPITLQAMTTRTGLPSDWSVDRMNNDGAYADGNICVMSTKANRAKGAKSLAQVIHHARHDDNKDLTTREWWRLASLMSGATLEMDEDGRPYAYNEMIPQYAPFPFRGLAFKPHQYIQEGVANAVRSKRMLRQVESMMKHLAGGDKMAYMRAEFLIDQAKKAYKKILAAHGEDYPGNDIWFDPQVARAFDIWSKSMTDAAWERFNTVMSNYSGELTAEMMCNEFHIGDRGYWSPEEDGPDSNSNKVPDLPPNPDKKKAPDNDSDGDIFCMNGKGAKKDEALAMALSATLAPRKRLSQVEFELPVSSLARPESITPGRRQRAMSLR
jgi:hypothetical protein